MIDLKKVMEKQKPNPKVVCISKIMTDYQEFTKKTTPKDERRNLDVGDIWSNSIQCLDCLDIIRSKNRHDMVYCKCEAVFVDGGSWYQRCGGKDLSKIKSLVEYYDDRPQKSDGKNDGGV